MPSHSRSCAPCFIQDAYSGYVCTVYVFVMVNWVSLMWNGRAVKCRFTCEMEAHIYVQMDFQVGRLIYQATLTKGMADQIET